jgi:hypothetical protein
MLRGTAAAKSRASEVEDTILKLCEESPNVRFRVSLLSSIVATATAALLTSPLLFGLHVPADKDQACHAL